MSRVGALTTVVVLVGVVGATACKEEDKRVDPLAVQPLSKEERKKQEEEKTRESLKKHARDKGEVIVGGCKESCEDPKNAFRNYIRTLFGVAAEGGPELKRFIDTTTLVDNGEARGKRWADMWINHERDTRLAEVRVWMDAFYGRYGKAEGSAEVEESLVSGTSFRRISSVLVEFEYFPPPLTGGTPRSERWKIKMGKRGLEWLVSEVYDQ